MRLKRFDEGVKRFSAYLSYAGGVWIVILMLLITVDVLGRILINQPLKGVPELVMNSVAAIAFFMIPWAAYEGRHLRSTLILDRVSTLHREIINLASHLIGFLLFCGIVVAGWKPTLSAIRILEYEGEGALRVPTYPVRVIIMFGSLLMAWQCLRALMITAGWLFRNKAK